ncbi:MAG TPA: amidohydrolase family protein [Blastocatellia bacterium]|nr:amidohydrolase family protein [Blastocatellia bacterium]
MSHTHLILRLLLLPAMATSATAQQLKAITGVTVIDGTNRSPIRDAVVIIESNRIKQVGSRSRTTVPVNAEVIDGTGKFLIPGLTDMHNHVLTGTTRWPQDRKVNLRLLLAYGVTTVFNPTLPIAEHKALKAATAQAEGPYARFYSTGPSISVKGDDFAAFNGSPTPETEEEAIKAVRGLKAAGVDAIKVVNDDLSWCKNTRAPLMRREVLIAVVSEAHKLGLKVYAHAPVLSLAKEFLKAGGDGLLHGIIDEPVDQEFIRLMKRNNAFYVATLSMFEDVADVSGWMRRQAEFDERKLFPQAVYDAFTNPASPRYFKSPLNNTARTRELLPTLRANLKKVSDAGIPIVAGTDAGYFGVLLGISSQLELTLMVESGLKPEEAIRAATITPARVLGTAKDSGSVEAGKFADMVILDRNPLSDIGNLRYVHRVIKAGVVYNPSELIR